MERCFLQPRDLGKKPICLTNLDMAINLGSMLNNGCKCNMIDRGKIWVEAAKVRIHPTNPTKWGSLSESDVI